ncbi:MAG: hypothetical protein OXI73_15790 [Rhodospirillales bacterium]|nr:hypothetical protein [Rhodospirillales bacterium]
MADPVNQNTQPTDDTVRLVWEGMVESDRLSRYYGYLAHRLKRLGELLQVAAVVFGVLALCSIFYRLPGWIAFSAANFAAFSYALSSIRGYSAKADRSVEIFRQLHRMQLEWELLWNNVWSKHDDGLLPAWKKLCERQGSILERAPVELPLSRSLARRSENEANEYWSAFARDSEDGAESSS